MLVFCVVIVGCFLVVALWNEEGEREREKERERERERKGDIV